MLSAPIRAELRSGVASGFVPNALGEGHAVAGEALPIVRVAAATCVDREALLFWKEAACPLGVADPAQGGLGALRHVGRHILAGPALGGPAPVGQVELERAEARGFSTVEVALGCRSEVRLAEGYRHQYILFVRLVGGRGDRVGEGPPGADVGFPPRRQDLEHREEEEE